MATSIGNLAVILSANTSKYSAGLRNAGKGTARFSRETQQQLDRIKTAFRLAGAAAGAAFVLGVRSQFRRLDEIGKTARTIGLSVEELSRLQLGAELSGVKVETLGRALTNTTRVIGEAASGSKEYKDILDTLGVDAERLANIPLRQAIGEIADGFAGMENKTKAAALATELFGARGARMLVLLRGGSAGLAEFDKMADKTGRTVSGEMVQAAEQFNDSITMLKGSLGGIAALVAGTIAPALTKLTRGITRVTSAFRSSTPTLEGTAIQGAAIAAAFTAGAAIAAKLTGIVIALAKALKAAAGAQKLLLAFSGPKGWAALAGGVAAVSLATAAMSKEFKETDELMADAQAGVAGLAGGLEEFSGEMRDTLADSGLQQRAKAIFDSTRTPMEQMQSRMEEIRTLSEAGLIDPDTTIRAIQKIKAEFDKLEDPIAGVRDEVAGFKKDAADFLDSLLTPTERIERRMKRIAELFGQGFLGPFEVEALMRQAAAERQQIADQNNANRMNLDAAGDRMSQGVSFRAQGAAAASGRKTDQLLKVAKDDLAEQKRQSRMDRERNEVLKSLTTEQAIRVVSF